MDSMKLEIDTEEKELLKQREDSSQSANGGHYQSNSNNDNIGDILEKESIDSNRMEFKTSGIKRKKSFADKTTSK